MPQHALICQVQNWLCALPIAHVVETLRPLPVRALAGAPSFVLGLTVLRGQAVPVVDAARLLSEAAVPMGHAAAVSGSQRFVAITAGERRLALVVDAVLGLRPIDRGSLHALPPLLQQAQAGFVERIGLLDNELLLVLQHAQLVPESVWAELQAAGGSASDPAASGHAAPDLATPHSAAPDTDAADSAAAGIAAGAGESHS